MAIYTVPTIARNLPPIEFQNNNYTIKVPIYNINNVPYTRIALKISGATGNSNKAAIIESDLSNPDSQGNYSFTINKNSISSKFQIYSKLYYKIQVTFEAPNSENSNVYDQGPWSQTGIAKCVDLDDINLDLWIEEGSNGFINTHLKESQQVIGVVGITKDYSEYVEEYQFILKEKLQGQTNYNTIYDTGWLIHNQDDEFNTGEIDGTRLCLDKVVFPTALDSTSQYKITYRVKLHSGIELNIESNALQVSTYAYSLSGFQLFAENNEANGYIKLTLDNQPNLVQQLQQSKYRILRSSIKENYKIQTVIGYLDVKSQILPIEIFKDYSCEQGVSYIYSLQGTKSDWTAKTPRLKSLPVTANFEHMYLSDAEHTLAIKFNPKVSTFKTVKLEGKTDTIGGKYPFFTRNGHTSYKQLAINGLISVFMDEQQLFGEHDDIYSWNLDGENMERERKFKLAVEEWLNNGKPKLFRSAAEGNYLVMLQGISLSPEDKLGRMLHNFSATAYEMADCTLDNFIKYNILPYTNIKVLNTTYGSFANIATGQTGSVQDIKLNTIKTIILSNLPNNCKIDINGDRDHRFENWTDSKIEIPCKFNYGSPLQINIIKRNNINLTAEEKQQIIVEIIYKL